MLEDDKPRKTRRRKHNVEPGAVFTWLTVVEECYRQYGGKRTRMAECICDCGVTCYAPITGLCKGEQKSCGCYRIALTIARNKRYPIDICITV